MDLTEKGSFAWYEAPEKALNKNTVFSFQQLLLGVFSTTRITGRHYAV